MIAVQLLATVTGVGASDSHSVPFLSASVIS
jgi:hypothetical protein